LRERIQVGDHSAMFRAFFYDLQRCLDDPSGVPRCVFDDSSMRPRRLLGHSSMHHRRLFSDFSSESSANLSSEKLSGSSVCTNRHEQVASDPSVELFSCVLRELFRATFVRSSMRISYTVSGSLRTQLQAHFMHGIVHISGTLQAPCQAHIRHTIRRISYTLSGTLHAHCQAHIVHTIVSTSCIFRAHFPCILSSEKLPGSSVCRGSVAHYLFCPVLKPIRISPIHLCEHNTS